MTALITAPTHPDALAVTATYLRAALAAEGQAVPVHRVEEFGFAASLNDPVSNSPMSRLTVQIQMRGAAA
jgi:hypothetical protein